MKLISYHFLLFFLLLLITCKNINAQAPSWLWAKSVSMQGNCYSVVLDDSGNVYSTGDFGGTVDFDPGPGTFNLTSISGFDMYVIKLSSAGKFIWAKRMGGASSNGAGGRGIALDDSGNVFTTGLLNGTIDFDPDTGVFNLSTGNPTGMRDLFILKLNSKGKFIWAKQIGGTLDDIGFSMAIDKRGNICLTGRFSGTVDFNPGPGIINLVEPGISYDIYILKLTKNGDFIWAKRIGNNALDEGYAIEIDANGNIYSAGQYQSTVDFDPGPGIFNLTTSVAGNYILKLDSLGNFIWAKRVFGQHPTPPYFYKFMDVNDAGELCITGKFSGTFVSGGSGANNFTSAGSYDIFVSKYTPSGTLAWAKQLGGLGEENATSVNFGKRGDIFTTGSFKETADLDPGAGVANFTSNTFNSDIFVTKLNSLGEFVWAKAVGGGNSDEGRLLAIGASDEVHLIGGYGAPNYSVTFDSITLANGGWFFAKLACSSFSTVTIKACNKYLSPSGKYLWTNSGIYKDTVASAGGCDSVINIHLTINSLSSASSQTLTACDSFISPSKKYTWITSGIYTDTIPNFGGCDSILTINLTVNNYSTSSKTDTVCGGLSSPSGNYFWNISGIYKDTIPNAFGCDSLLTINLIIRGTSSIQSISSCNSYTSPSGKNNWTSSGVYHDTIPNSNGCDSLMTINLTITSIDTAVVQNGITLTSSLSAGTYQWLNCNNNYAPINGAINKSFTATANGSFAVQLSKNNCLDTSACVSIIEVGVNEMNSTISFEFFPNPAKDKLFVLSNDGVLKELQIYDVYERILYSHKGIDANQFALNCTGFESGMYFIKLSTSTTSVIRKLFIEK